MFKKLEELEKKYEELNKNLSDPNIIADQAKFQECAKMHSDISKAVLKYKEYKDIIKEIEENSKLFSEEKDIEFKKLISEEVEKLKENKSNLEIGLKEIMFPNWKTEVMSSSPTGIGGFKEIIFSIIGIGVYGKLKYESGVHRVQRVPITESSGRIHTSTVTVAILPEAEEVELEISPNDLKIDRFRSTGPGGQSVNTTDSAIRITHIPTGMVVTCQDEKSQHKNKAKALKILRARLLDMAEREKHEELAQKRKSQVGTGDRSERIRTYNFPQNRITDHRIGLNLHNLEEVLEGNLNNLVANLLEKLKTSSEI
jgi:peptide chain release factor 1